MAFLSDLPTLFLNVGMVNPQTESEPPCIPTIAGNAFLVEHL